MKFYLEYLGEKKWREIDVDESKIIHLGNGLLYHNFKPVYEADTEDKYLFMRFPNEIHFKPETAKLIYKH